jgi:hypothetical protein
MTPENPNYAPIPRDKPLSISDSVGVSIEAAKILGLDIARDPELLRSVLTNDYERLFNGQSRPGEAYIHLDVDTDYKLIQMLDVIDDIEYDGTTFPKHDIWHPHTHWTGGTSEIKHLLVGLGKHHKHADSFKGSSGQSHIALNDGENFLAPFAHFTNQPYDKHNVSDDDRAHGVHTQLESLSLETAKFEAENPGFYMTSLDVASFAMLVLQKRIKGESLQYAFGAMVIPDLGRRALINESHVRIVHIRATGQMGLGKLRGNPSQGSGVGLIIGHN